MSSIRAVSLVGLMTMLVALAGCQDATPNEGADPEPDEPTITPTATDAPPPSPSGNDTSSNEIPWELLDCFFIYAQPLAIGSEVAADLPAGFAAATNTAGRTTVGFETNECTTGSGLDDMVSPQTYATVWVPVTPAPELAVEQGAGHFVNFDVLVQDAERRAWMQDRGLSAQDGSISRSDIVDGLFTVDFSLDGVGAFRFTIAEIQPAANAGGAFDQWTPGTEGLTYWRTDWATSEQFTAVGTIEIAPGSIYADWFELPIVPATFNFGTWDYTDGRIVHPAPTE